MLNRQEIEGLIKQKNLVTGFLDLGVQLAPNGFDMTVDKVFSFAQSGSLDFSNHERKLPQYDEIPAVKKMPADEHGWWHLAPGGYKISSNEVVNMPSDLAAIAFPRSSLLRMGAFTQTGVWDAGFKGKSEFILIVNNPAGLNLKQNARVIQLVFYNLNKTDKIYEGIYQQSK